jgi:hypothetical protein
MELVVIELDTSAELDATKCAEVTSAELVSATDLNSGRDRWWSVVATGDASMDGGGAGEQRGQNPSCDHKRDRTT